VRRRLGAARRRRCRHGGQAARRDVLDALVRSGRSAWVWAGVVTALAWPTLSVRPELGGDQSSFMALYLATRHGLDFGREIAWTYGPLGFLHQLRFFSGALYALAFAYTLLVRFALSWFLIRAIRRTFPLAVAVVITWAVASIIGQEAELPLLVIWGLEVLRAPADSGLRRSFPFMAGVAVAAAWLIKFNVAFLATAVAILVVARETLVSRRAALRFVVAGTVAAAVLLAATRQGAPVDYLINGLSISAAYASGMGLDSARLTWQYPAAAVVVLTLLFAAWSESRRRDAPPRGLMLAVTVIGAWLFFKEGFVRHDGHGQIFFTASLAVALTFRASIRPRAVASLMTVLLGTLAGVALTTPPSPSHLLDPGAHTRALVDDTRLLVDPGWRARVFTDSADAIKAAFPVPPALLAIVADHTTAVLPVLIAPAWAYHLRWRPLPVFQPYATLSSRLDDLNRRFVLGRDAPERILWHVPGTIDGRNPQFDSPAAMVAILCRYRQAASAGAWQVLTRAADRCRTPRKLVSETAPSGRAVAVPAPTSPRALVVVRIHGVGLEGFEHVEDLLFRPPERTISVDGRRFRLVTGTAEDETLVSATRGIDYAPPWQLAPQAHTIAAAVSGDSTRRVRYDFFEIPVQG
jgi:hypothetical protein